MKELPTYTPNFEEYIRLGEPDKKERAQIWRNLVPEMKNIRLIISLLAVTMQIAAQEDTTMVPVPTQATYGTTISQEVFILNGDKMYDAQGKMIKK